MDISKELEYLQRIIKDRAPTTAVAFSFFMNSEGCEWTMRLQNQDALKHSSVSTRNLRGEWIVESEK